MVIIRLVYKKQKTNHILEFDDSEDEIGFNCKLGNHLEANGPTRF